MTMPSSLEHNTRAIAEKCVSAAWEAFDSHRPELASRLIWDATDAALRSLARQRGRGVNTPDDRIALAELLDVENGSERYYIQRLMLCEYFQNNAEFGVMPGDDPRDCAWVAAEFIDHLLELAEAAP